MQRPTNRERALQYAKDRNIELTVEPGSEFGIEIWGASAHYSFDEESHMEINYLEDEVSGYQILTEPALWKYSLDRMKSMSQCQKTCSCYE